MGVWERGGHSVSSSTCHSESSHWRGQEARREGRAGRDIRAELPKPEPARLSQHCCRNGREVEDNFKENAPLMDIIIYQGPVHRLGKVVFCFVLGFFLML